MSQSPKNSRNKRGKNKLSLQKRNQPKQSQSIITLFKKQNSIKCNASWKKSSEHPKESEMFESTDNDVEIIEVDTLATKYFSSKKSKSSQEDRCVTESIKGNSYASKLRIRRSKSVVDKKEDAGSETADGEKLSLHKTWSLSNKTDDASCKATAGERVEESQKHVDTGVFSTMAASQNSQKENQQKDTQGTSVKPKKLSLRKRSLVKTELEGPDTSHASGGQVKLRRTDASKSNNTLGEDGGLLETNGVKKRNETSKKTFKISQNTEKESAKNRLTDNIAGNLGEDGYLRSEHVTDNSEHMTCSSEHSIDSSEHDIVSSEHGIDSSEPSTFGGGCDSSLSSHASTSEAGSFGSLKSDKGETGQTRHPIDPVPDPLNVEDTCQKTGAVDNEADLENDPQACQEDEAEHRDRIPYYLENFTIILNSVLDDVDNRHLFSDEDMEVVQCFRSLSEPGQKLYVRLFSRKLTWHSFNKISYSQIAEDLFPVLQELITSGLAMSDANLNELEEILRLLPALQLKTLAKSFSINITGQQKGQLVEALLKQSKQNTIRSFFTKSAKAGANVMLERAKKLLGHSFKLVEEPRSVFVRALMLFSVINTSPEEDSSHGGQGQLFQMLLVNMGKLVYPKYTINKESSIFQTREQLLRFSTAMLLEYDLITYTEKGNYEGAHDLYLEAKKTFEQLRQDKDLKWDMSLPSFLRRYTASEIYTRVLSMGVEILQRLKKYELAVEQLHSLLAQTTYCLNYRGHWYDRLALNLDQHLKKPADSLTVIHDGLNDPRVRVGHRYSLYWRAEKICSAPKSKLSKRLADIPEVKVKEYSKVTVEGKVISKTIPGARFTFMTENSDSAGDGVTVCGVEQLVLDHYKQRGFPEGIHAEGSLVSTLFWLFFWDIIFKDVPDAFHSPFQPCPLDYHNDHFYEARKSLIDNRIQEISEKKEEDLLEMMSQTWETQNGVRCAGLNWERFESLEHAQGFISCMGGKALAGLVGRFAKDPRHTRSGFPDLTLWNPENKTFKFSEVKGPGDRLSHNQIMWLDYLVRLGADAEVCHVKAVTGKKLRPKCSEDVGEGKE